jgi:hypothetical protein
MRNFPGIGAYGCLDTSCECHTKEKDHPDLTNAEASRIQQSIGNQPLIPGEKEPVADWEMRFNKLVDGIYGYVHQSKNDKLVDFIVESIDIEKERSYAEGFGDGKVYENGALKRELMEDIKNSQKTFGIVDNDGRGGAILVEDAIEIISNRE